MEEGNERIIVIGIGIGDRCTVIINAYLPSGSTVTEIEQHRDTLEDAKVITLKMQRLSGLVI